MYTVYVFTVYVNSTWQMGDELLKKQH
jgi:hypothetical protein